MTTPAVSGSTLASGPRAMVHAVPARRSRAIRPRMLRTDRARSLAALAALGAVLVGGEAGPRAGDGHAGGSAGHPGGDPATRCHGGAGERVGHLVRSVSRRDAAAGPVRA